MLDSALAEVMCLGCFHPSSVEQEVNGGSRAQCTAHRSLFEVPCITSSATCFVCVCVCVCVTGFGGIIGSDLLPVEQSWQSSNSKRGRGSLVEECVLL